MFKQKVLLVVEKDRRLYYLKIQRKPALTSQAPLPTKRFHRRLLAFEPVSFSLQSEVTEQRATSADAAAIWDLCGVGGTAHTFPWFPSDNLWMGGEIWPRSLFIAH